VHLRLAARGSDAAVGGYLGLDGYFRVKVSRKDAGGKDVRTKDDKGVAVWKPRDDVADVGVGEKGVQPHGKDFLFTLGRRCSRRRVGRLGFLLDDERR
jgi:hypothetical protein